MAPDQLLEQKQAEKKEVKGYFETTGFDRWNRIYSDSDDVNKVQRNIRIGHQKTVDEVLAWIKESGELSQASFCDAGCGVAASAFLWQRWGPARSAPATFPKPWPRKRSAVPAKPASTWPS